MRSLFFLLVFSFSFSAVASTSYPGQLFFSSSASPPGDPFQSLQAAADATCAMPGRYGLERNDGPYGSVPNQQWLVYCYNQPNQQAPVLGGSVSSYFACPYGGSLSGGVCINAPNCPEGQSRDTVTGQCVSPPCQSGDIAASGYFPIGNDPTQSLNFPSYACVGGCSAIFNGSAPGARQLVNSKYFYYAKGQYIKTGESCTGSIGPAGQAALPAPSCADGDAMGTINGQTVCVSKGTGTTVNPYSPQQGPTTTTTNNGDGTTTVKTDDPNGGGTVTTSGPGGSTTTNTPGVGGSGDGQSGNGGATGTWGENGTGDKQDDQGDGICDKNPGAALCKDKVPIDEDGTPQDASGMLQAQVQKLDEDATAIEGWFQNRTWEVTSLPFIWNPPVPSGGSCSDIDLIKGQKLEICQSLGIARDIWAWVFGVLCSMAIWIRGTTVNKGA